MAIYNDFKVEALLENPSFRRWVYEKASAHETEYWETLYYSNSTAADSIEQAKAILLSIAQPSVSLSDEHIWKRTRSILKHTESKKSIFRVNLWSTGIAAMLAICIGVGGWMVYKNQKPHTNPSVAQVTGVQKELPAVSGWEKVKTTAAEQRPVLLPDGSSVVLKPNSELSYPREFDSARREVYLVGEGFFEVKKNRQKPFYVYTHDVVTKVTGTSFVIRAFTSDEEVKVSVKTGKVSVYKKQPKSAEPQPNVPPIVVLPHQQATFLRLGATPTIRPVTLPELTEVEKESFVFARTPIREVFQLLERTYNVKINYEDEVMKNCTLTASLGDRPLLEKLDLICAGIESSYEYKSGEVTIRSKGCSTP